MSPSVRSSPSAFPTVCTTVLSSTCTCRCPPHCPGTVGEGACLSWQLFPAHLPPLQNLPAAARAPSPGLQWW
jgi:hypothetical protein